MKPVVIFTVLLILSGCSTQPVSSCLPERPTEKDCSSPQTGTLRSGIQIGGHLTNSFTWNILRHPISATRDLLALATNVSTGIVKDMVIDHLLLPELETQPIPTLAEGPGMDLIDWEARLDKLTGTRQQIGELGFHVDGEAFFNRLSQAIADAQESVKIRTYIFDNDDVALQVADQLKARSKDIPVTVLFDGIGSLSGSLVQSESLPAAYRSPASMRAYLRQNSKVRVRMLPNTWLMGDHSKTFIFDERIAFLGGMNIGREYRYDWHDMMVELRGPVVRELVNEHDNAWRRSGMLGDLAAFAGDPDTSTAETPAFGKKIRLLYTRPYDPQIYRAQLAAIRHASKYIYIENAYFSDDRVLYELARARRRGVDVRVILPSRGDSGPMDRSNRVATNRLLENGITVYRYPGMSHIKAAIIDGWACLGSANFDKMSLKLNAEINIATSDTEIVDELIARVFAPDFAASTQILSHLQIALGDQLYEILADMIL